MNGDTTIFVFYFLIVSEPIAYFLSKFYHNMGCFFNKGTHDWSNLSADYTFETQSYVTQKPTIKDSFNIETF